MLVMATPGKMIEFHFYVKNKEKIGRESHQEQLSWCSPGHVRFTRSTEKVARLKIPFLPRSGSGCGSGEQP